MTCPCSSLSSFVDRVAASLNDAAHDHWSVSLIVSHLNEGLCQIQGYRPDAFAETIPLALRAGSYQELPKGYTALHSVVGNIAVDAGGGITATGGVTTTATTASKYLTGKRCLTSDLCSEGNAPRIESVIINPLNPRLFTVEPPVPSDGAVTIRVNAIKAAETHSAANLGACVGVDCKYESDLFNWVMMRCYELDLENGKSAEMAKYYREGFYQDQQSTYVQDQRVGSGFFLGKNPRDPNADTNFKQH